MTNTTERLRECPFCGGNLIGEIVPNMHCRTCNAMGPVAGSTEDAIAKWNARAVDRGRADLPRLEEVARIIDPGAFYDHTDPQGVTTTKPLGTLANQRADAKARAILSLFEKGR